MALTISLLKDDGFWIVGETPAQDKRFVMDEVYLSRGFVLVDGSGVKYDVTPNDEVEIFPEVWVSDGHRQIVGKARCVFDAPKSIRILRDELYNQLGRNAASAA